MLRAKEETQCTVLQHDLYHQKPGVFLPGTMIGSLAQRKTLHEEHNNLNQTHNEQSFFTLMQGNQQTIELETERLLFSFSQNKVKSIYIS